MGLLRLLIVGERVKGINSWGGNWKGGWVWVGVIIVVGEVIIMLTLWENPLLYKQD